MSLNLGGNLESLKLEDVSVPEGFTKSISGNTATIGYTPTDINLTGVRPQYTVSYSYVEVIPATYKRDEQGNVTDEIETEEQRIDRTGTLTKVSDQTFYTYSEPQAATFSSTDKQWRLDTDGDPIVYTAESGSGGNPNGWRYRWSGNAGSGSSATLRITPSSFLVPRATTVVTNLEVTNYAPDNQTVWGTTSAQYKLYVYREHGIKLMSNINFDGADGVFYKQCGNLELTSPATYSGVIEYNWSTASGKTGKENTFCPYPDAQTDMVKDVVKCEVVAFDDEGYELPDSRKTVIDNYEITIYGEASVTHSALENSTFDDRTIVLSAGTNGGFPEGWEYQWSENGVTIGTESHLQLDNLKPGTHTYTLQTVNQFNDSSKPGFTSPKQWFDNSYDFTVLVEKAPNAASTTELIKEDLNHTNITVKDVIPTINLSGSDVEPTTLSSPIYLVEGETLSLSHTGSDGGVWTYEGSYLPDNGGDAVSMSDPFTFVAPHVESPQKGKYTLIATYKAASVDESVTYSYTYDNLTVIPTPQLLEDNKTKDVYIGESSSFMSMGIGGIDEGWVTEWTDENGEHIDIEEMASAGKPQSLLKYNAHVMFSTHGVTRIDASKTYTLRTWPKPEVEVNKITVYTSSKNYKAKDFVVEPADGIIIPCYIGDSISIVVTNKGGYISSRDSWVYSVGDADDFATGGNTTFVIKGKAKEVSIKEPALLPILVKNVYTGTDDGSKIGKVFDCGLKLLVFPTPAITEYIVDSEFDAIHGDADKNPTIQVYDDGEKNTITYSVGTEGGNPDGWQYKWLVTDLNDNIVHQTSTPTLTFQPRANTGERTGYKINLEVSNSTDYSTYIYKDKQYVVWAWPKADIPSAFNIIDKNQNRILTGGNMCVRQDNALEIIQDEFTGGYRVNSASIVYDWGGAASGQTKRRFFTNATIENNTNRKSITEMSYTLTTRNMGPYGNYWDETVSEAQTISVFARPETPFRFWKKGTGASGTVIAEVGLSDQQIVDYEYYLVFGFDVKSGNEWNEVRKVEVRPSLQGEGQTRYTTSFTAAELQNSNNRFWVYTVWKYVEDGAVITSGKKYLDGSMDFSWDGSDYSHSTRATRGLADEESTAVESVTDSDSGGDAAVEGYYGIDGIKTAVSRRGINIIRMTDGKVRKVYVK